MPFLLPAQMPQTAKGEPVNAENGEWRYFESG
jgi:hypothetical protein